MPALVVARRVSIICIGLEYYGSRILSRKWELQIIFECIVRRWMIGSFRHERNSVGFAGEIRDLASKR